MSGCLSCHSILDWTVRSEWQYTLCYLQWKIHNNAVLPHSGIARSDTAQDVVLLATWILFIARSDTVQDVVLLATWNLFIARISTTVFYTSCYSSGFPTVCHTMSACSHSSDEGPSFHLSHTHTLYQLPLPHPSAPGPSAICIICLVNNNIMVSG